MSKTKKAKLPSAQQRWTRADGERILDEWRRSGLTLAEFARRVGSSAERIRWWQKHLGKGGNTMRLRLVPAVVRVPSLVTGAAPVVIRLPDGVGIELSDERLVSPAAIASFVAELRGIRS